MAIEVLTQIKKNLDNSENLIREARTLVSVMKAAGENTLEVEQKLRELEKKREKWQSALREAGY